MRTTKKFGLVAALAIVVAVCVGCDPGWVNPVLGSGDGSGSVPGDQAGVAAADVALGSPWALADLGARGYLVYDDDNCTIMSVADGAATRSAGNGTCGEAGDGGLATAAQIQVVPAPLGAGLQVDPDGNVYFVNSPTGNIRRIDAVTNVISTVVADPGGFVYGISAEAGGVITYLVNFAWSYPVAIGSDEWETLVVPEIRRLDATGEHIVASLYTGTAWTPVGFVRVGPEHYVTFLDNGDGSHDRIDAINGEMSTTAIELAEPGLIPEAVGADGSIYGITQSPPPDGLEGNHVFRMNSDGSVDFIAGSGEADSGTKRQTGTGAALDLNAWALAMTGNGNLLIASGHAIYNMHSAGTAPAIAAP